MTGYYYVKDDGTAAAATDDGRYTSLQTGSFAALGTANYYASTKDAVAASTSPASGDFILISDASALTYASGDIVVDNGLGTVNTHIPVALISVDDTAVDAYAKATAAQEKSSDATDDLTYSGHWAMYGVYLESAQNLKFYPANTEGLIYFKNCTLVCDNGHAITMGGGRTGHLKRIQSCTLDQSATSTHNSAMLILPGGLCEMLDTAFGPNRSSNFAGGHIQTQQTGGALISGLDTSTQTVGWISGSGGGEISQILDFVGCLRATGATNTKAGGNVAYADIIDRMNYVDFDGLEDEWDSMYGDCLKQLDVTRDGGSSYSWKITTKVSASEGAPFYSPWITGHFDSTAAKTVDIYIGTDDADYNNDQLWLELEYFKNSGNPLYGLYTTARISPFHTAANPHDAADSSTWSGTGAPSTNKHILRGSCTPGQVGPFRVRLGFGKASVSGNPLYVDPLIVVT